MQTFACQYNSSFTSLSSAKTPNFPQYNTAPILHFDLTLGAFFAPQKTGFSEAGSLRGLSMEYYARRKTPRLIVGKSRRGVSPPLRRWHPLSGVAWF
jgi:hypothetical protein